PVAWAAALAAACPPLGTPGNLLPEALRASSSRAQYVPTAVLASALALLGVAMIADSAWMDRQYRMRLEAEMARLAPAAQEVEKLDRQLAAAVKRIELLEGYRRRTRTSLDTLLELTGMIEPPGWLMSLQMAADQVTLWGESPRADELLKKLDASPRFHSAEFTAPLSRGAGGDVFRIRARREEGGR
ncbi:MAG: PilN domain-containing protein, partial [Bryobacteraceae bacterium]